MAAVSCHSRSLVVIELVLSFPAATRLLSLTCQSLLTWLPLFWALKSSFETPQVKNFASENSTWVQHLPCFRTCIAPLGLLHVYTSFLTRSQMSLDDFRCVGNS